MLDAVWPHIRPKLRCPVKNRERRKLSAVDRDARLKPAAGACMPANLPRMPKA
jgi:hypothetical protein